MTASQKQSVINTLAIGTGDLVSRLRLPDATFITSLDRLIHTLQVHRSTLVTPTILDTSEDDDL